jgi:hypothetical protein
MTSLVMFAATWEKHCIAIGEQLLKQYNSSSCDGKLAGREA